MAKNSKSANSGKNSFDNFLLRANDKAKKPRCLDLKYRDEDGFCGLNELLENEKNSQQQEHSKQEAI